MNRLRQADLLAVLGFVHEATELVGGDDVFPPPVLDRLAQLVRCDVISYCELNRRRQRTLKLTGSPEVVAAPDNEERFWRIAGQHPLCRHQARTRDFSAAKLSDFLTLRQLHRTELYAEWFRIDGFEYELEVGIPSPLSHTKTFLFDRGVGRDFSERDRLVLDLLQPHLRRLYEIAELRRRLEDGRVGPNDDLPLTLREREILKHVRAGRTNGEIACLLWISPLTVRRHLENAYKKLDVHTRTAAVARLSSN